MAVDLKKFWTQTLLQVVVLVVAMAVAWGYQRSEVDRLRSDVVRIDTQGPVTMERRLSELAGKIDSLTVEVRYLHEMIQQLREDRDARVHRK
jgi:hypothetical protein